MPEPLFSVVIDNYNFDKYLGEAIESVLSQDFPSDQVELVVVDDGSTDGSREIIRSFGDRVRPLLQKNQGQAAAFNNGIRFSTGKLVCLLDSDDYWHKDKLKKVAERFEREPGLGIVQHYLTDVDNGRNSLANPLPPWPDAATIDDFLDGRLPFAATTALTFRRDVLLKNLPIPKEYFCYLDTYLTVKILLHAPMGNIREVLGYHRIHGRNFWAAQLNSKEVVERELYYRELFHNDLQRWLDGAGKEMPAKYRELEALEIMRRKILLAAYRGDRREAFSLWRRGWAEHRGKPFGKFRLLTCALALLSPRLYVGLYNYYSRHHRLFVGKREALFPVKQGPGRRP